MEECKMVRASWCSSPSKAGKKIREIKSGHYHFLPTRGGGDFSKKNTHSPTPLPPFPDGRMGWKCWTIIRTFFTKKLKGTRKAMCCTFFFDKTQRNHKKMPTEAQYKLAKPHRENSMICPVTDINATLVKVHRIQNFQLSGGGGRDF